MDGFVEVRFVGGSHDGQVRQWPAGMVHEGGEHALPRSFGAAPAEAPAGREDPVAGWERYIFREGVRGWVATLAPGR